MALSGLVREEEGRVQRAKRIAAAIGAVVALLVAGGATWRIG